MSSVENRVCIKILDRAELGKEKYGVTMDRTDLTELQWLVHAQEEAMDLAIYLEKLIKTKTNERTDNQSAEFGTKKKKRFNCSRKIATDKTQCTYKPSRFKK